MASLLGRRTAFSAGSLVLKRQIDLALRRHLYMTSKLNGGHGHGHGHHVPSHGGEFRYEPIRLEIGSREVSVGDYRRGPLSRSKVWFKSFSVS